VPFDPELATRGLPGPTAGALADALGSSVPRVAEVAGLAVPAGTDWSHGRAIGTISGLLASSWLTGKLSIELAGAPADDLYLHVDETGDPTTAFAPCWINIGPGATTSGGPVGAVNRVGNIAWGVVQPDLVTSVLLGVDPSPMPSELFVYLATAGATTADIAVVRARAAFLVV
jgi:hypothetical protein